MEDLDRVLIQDLQIARGVSPNSSGDITVDPLIGSAGNDCPCPTNDGSAFKTPVAPGGLGGLVVTDNDTGDCGSGAASKMAPTRGREPGWK